MKGKNISISAVLLTMILLTGCASMFLGGSNMWKKGNPKHYAARYLAPVCINAKRKKIDAPIRAVYYLKIVEGKVSLLELEDGKGVVVSNHWIDKKGNDNFVVYVKGSLAWHYILPQNRRRPGIRIVYRNGKYKIHEDKKGVLRITGGNAFAVCKMQPQ